MSTDRVLGSDAARAVGRFNPDGPQGYRAKSVPGAPVRATRAEAVEDERKWWQGRRGHIFELCATPDCPNRAWWIPVSHVSTMPRPFDYYCPACCDRIADEATS